MAIQTKWQVAYEAIRQRIMQAKLLPGERLVIDRLATELEISAIPVREALAQLQREGLVEIRPHAGAQVAELPPQAIHEIFALLESVEMAACRLALPVLRPEHLEELRRQVAHMRGLKQDRTWLQANRRFHDSLPQLCGLDRIGPVLHRCGEQWERLRLLHFASVPAEDRARADDEHEQFIDLLQAADLPGLEQWIRTHNRRALSRYIETAAC